MAIGTPVVLGSGYTNKGAGAANLVVTTTVAHSAGDRIVVAVSMHGDASCTGITDSAGNTYVQDATVATGATATDSRIYVFRSDGANALASGGTVTVACAGAASGVEGVVGAVSGCLTGSDSTGTGNGSGTSPSAGITTVAASTVTFAAMGLKKPGLGLVMYTEDSDYTTLFSGNSPTGTTEVTLAYRVKGSAGADTYAPTLDTSVPWTVGLDALPGNTAGLGARCDHLMPVVGAGG